MDKFVGAFDVVLTFDEIKRLYELMQERVEKRDYNGTPVYQLIFEPDEDWSEYQHVKCCCIHDITKACEKARETGGKVEVPYVDITDEMKQDMI